MYAELEICFHLIRLAVVPVIDLQYVFFASVVLGASLVCVCVCVCASVCVSLSVCLCLCVSLAFAHNSESRHNFAHGSCVCSTFAAMCFKH